MAAPAPSPNSTQVLRSCQLTTRLMTSAPTTAIRWAPLLINPPASSRPYKNPEQPALTSNAAGPRSPSLCCNQHAVDGNRVSGVEVPTMIASSSLGVRSAAVQARSRASAARSEVATPSSAIRRSRIPVRSAIHWSEVSTMASSSALVSTRDGRARAVAKILSEQRIGVPRASRSREARQAAPGRRIAQPLSKIVASGLQLGRWQVCRAQSAN